MTTFRNDPNARPRRVHAMTRIEVTLASPGEGTRLIGSADAPQPTGIAGGLHCDGHGVRRGVEVNACYLKTSCRS